VLQPNGSICTIERLQSGQQQVNYSYAAATPVHTWLRITRTSHLIVCWSSPDGVAWTARLVSGIPMQDTAVAGLVAAPTTGVNSWSPAWGSASYDQISVTKTSVLASVRSQAWQQYLQALPRLGGANPAYVVTDLTYDAESQLLSRTDGNGVATTFAYDPRGRLLSQSEAGATTLFAFDAVGNRTQVTSPRGLVTQLTYTQRNLPATVTEAVGTPEQTVVSTRTYTPTGKPATETDALGRVSTSGFGGCCDRLL
jgi:YD repeat-containing protein